MAASQTAGEGRARGLFGTADAPIGWGTRRCIGTAPPPPLHLPLIVTEELLGISGCLRCSQLEAGIDIRRPLTGCLFSLLGAPSTQGRGRFQPGCVCVCVYFVFVIEPPWVCVLQNQSKSDSSSWKTAYSPCSCTSQLASQPASQTTQARTPLGITCACQWTSLPMPFARRDVAMTQKVKNICFWGGEVPTGPAGRLFDPPRPGEERLCTSCVSLWACMRVQRHFSRSLMPCSLFRQASAHPLHTADSSLSGAGNPVRVLVLTLVWSYLG